VRPSVEKRTSMAPAGYRNGVFVGNGPFKTLVFAEKAGAAPGVTRGVA